MSDAVTVLRAMVLLALLKLALVLAGFGRTWSWLRRRTELAELSSDMGEDAVLRVERTVAMAAAFYPGRAQCLERSLVLYWWLRRRGVDVRYCMGVQAYPFLAHAWIEYRGQPINDVAEHVRRFRPIEGMVA